MKTVNKVIYREDKTYGVGSGEVTSYYLEIENSPIRLHVYPEQYDRVTAYDRKGHEHGIFVPDTKEHQQQLIDLLIYAFGLEDEDGE